MSDPATNYSVVLIGRYPGKDMAVAHALAHCMGREEAWGLRIVSSSPIIFFEKLSEKQARQIFAALAEVAEAGCRFEIQTGSNASLPKVGWASPPKINGMTIAEIAHNSTPSLVSQPGPTPVVQLASIPTPAPPSVASSGVHATQPALAPTSAPSAPSAENNTQGNAILFIPCPYTGKKIRLSIQVTLSRTDAGTSYAVSASASQAPVARSVERSSGVTGAVIPPVQQRPTGSYPLPRNSGPFQALGQTAAPTSDLERLESQLAPVANSSARPGSAPNILPPTRWARNTPSDIPLPDVPVLPASSFSPSRSPSGAQSRPLPLDSQPMDLSTFEANLGRAPRQPERAFAAPEPELNHGVEVEADDADEIENEDILCSVFIERSSSPVVHELVAELHGIPESEASEMCVNGSVALAENIPLFEAKDIKHRCAAINVFARIVRNE